MAELTTLIEGIREGLAGIDLKVSDSETKISKVVDALSALDESVKATTETHTADIKALQESHEAQKKVLMARISEVKESPWKGKLSTRAAEAFGHSIMATLHKNSIVKQKSVKWLDDNEFDFKAMSEGVGSSGGFAVPSVTVPEFIRLIETYGVFRSDARNVPLSTDSTTWPKRNGGLTVYVPGEGGTITASDVSMQSVGLSPKKLCTLTAISSELDEDAIVAVGQIVADEIAQAFALAEDQAGFLGDGTSTYWGFTGMTQALRGVDATIGSVAGITVGAGNAYSELTDANFQDVMGNAPDYADVGGNLRWYMSRKVYFATCVRLALAAGGVNATEMLNLPGGVKAYHGYAVRFVQAMPSTAANSQLAIFFANMQQGAYLGNRRSMTIDQSTDVYFASDQIGIRGTERIGISVHDVGDTSVAGSITALAMAAS